MSYTEQDIHTALTRELTDERVATAAAYWLDASPHERWVPDGIILARYARYAMAEIDRLKAERRWISVKERLPEPFEQVLVYVYAGISGRNSFRSIGSVTPIGKWVWDRNAVIFENARVTHWQPLPEPPERTVGD